MPSFDISSEVDLQEIDNAMNQTQKEIATRYDFRGSKASIEFDKKLNVLHLYADDDYKIKALIDIFQSKVVKRNISLKSLDIGKIQEGAASGLKVDIKLIMGIETEKAKEIVRSIKDAKMKVQGAIQEEKVRVTGKKRDDLQEAISLLKGKDFGIPLQFGNFRD